MQSEEATSINLHVYVVYLQVGSKTLKIYTHVLALIKSLPYVTSHTFS